MLRPNITCDTNLPFQEKMARKIPNSDTEKTSSESETPVTSPELNIHKQNGSPNTAPIDLLAQKENILEKQMNDLTLESQEKTIQTLKFFPYYEEFNEAMIFNSKIYSQIIQEVLFSNAEKGELMMPLDEFEKSLKA